MTATRPQALISNTTRAATAFAVAGLVSLACLAAAHESRHAVQESTAALAGPAIYVTLPTVEIVARKNSEAVSTAASRTTSQSL